MPFKAHNSSYVGEPEHLREMISPSETLLGKSQLPSQFFKGIHMTYALDATMV